MTEIERNDVVWQQALDWIMLEHEKSLDAQAQTALCDWLEEAPEHRQAYAQARTLWLITGLVPNTDEQADLPPSDK